MLQTVTSINLLLLVVAVCAFFILRKNVQSNIEILVFCLYLCLIDLTLFITALKGIQNHIIANINTIIYYPLAILVLFKILESVKGKNRVLRFIKYSLVGLIIIGWVFENFFVETILFYNSFLSSIISLVLVIISIYLINMLLFVKYNSIIRDSEGLLLIGMLIRFFSGGLLLLFMNYRMKFSNEFYVDVLLLVNLALIISNIFFLTSILCLPKKKRYTWPF